MNNLIAEDIIIQFKFFGHCFYVQWHITSDCTENCIHCYLDKSMDNVFDSIELCKDVINHIVHIPHDSIRQNGSFRKTIEGISILKRHKIVVSVKFTVSTLNYKEINDLLRYVSKLCYLKVYKVRSL